MKTTDITHVRLLAAAMAIGLLVAACSPPPSQGAVSDVSITGGNRTLTVGDSLQLDVTVVATGGASSSVTWSSSDEAVVNVSSAGVISGVAVGSAEVTATSVANPAVSDTITVTVVAAGTVNGVEIVGGDRLLDLWESVTLDVDVDVEAGTSQAVTWSTSEPSIVTVDGGLVVAVAAGASATITATSVVDPSQSDSITVTVRSLPSPTTSNLFVDASVPPGGNGHVDFPFQRITPAIDAVAVNGVVNVAAGTYDESLYIARNMQIVGADRGTVTIRSNENAPDPFAESSIYIESVSSVTLSGFRLDVEAPGPTFAAISVVGGSSNVVIEDIDIFHSNDARTTRGIFILNSSSITVEDVNVEAAADNGNREHAGAGVQVGGNSSNILLDGLQTIGHESFAGVVLRPGAPAATISDVTITTATSLGEINRMSLVFTAGGTVTGLIAPDFVAAVGNTAFPYGGGEIFFYKDDLERAILDSLFNFNEIWEVADGGDGQRSWLRSTVQLLDPVDQSIRLEEYVVGSVLDTVYGFGIVRSHFIQAAIDVAQPGATIEVRSGLFAGADEGAFGGLVADGAIVIDVPGLTIVGQGGSSRIGSDAGPVFTIDADDVNINGVQIEPGPSAAAGIAGIVLGTGDDLVLATSNVVTDVGIDNTAGATVIATGNYWNAASGPGGTGPGTGATIIDPASGVTFDPFATTPF